MTSPENQIFDYLNFLIIINKILGNFVFTNDFKLSKVTFLFAAALFSFRAHNTFLFVQNFKREGFFSYYIVVTNRTLSLLCYLGLCILTYIKVSFLKKLIYDLSRLDLYLYFIKIKVKYNKNKIVKFCVGRFFLYSFLGSIRFINGLQKFNLFLIYESFHRVAAVYYHNLIFVSLVAAISDHFEILSSQLERKKRKNSVKKILYGAKRLYDIWDTLYHFYGVQILFYTASVFVQIVEIFRAMRHTIFQNWRTILETLSWRELSSLFFSVLIAAFALSDTKQLLDVYETARKNANIFTLKLSRIYVQNEAEKSTQDFLGLHFAMKPNLNFDAIGFYMINNTLIFSMVSATFSYMIVLLQEEKSKNATQ